MNRLAEAKSTYLRQHAANPVDWWPWCDEAFDEAGRREVPVMLSIGYASCHWCHVMAHESFEDPEIAAVINRGFVPIKVDREQRPDIDAIYMTATQAMTGQGGWPLTCFLNADGEPFYAGTYYPPEQRGRMPSLPQVLEAVTQGWQDNHDRVQAQASRVADHLRKGLGDLPEAPLGAEELDRSAAAVLAELDTVHGGFGGAPKFPPTMLLEFLLRLHERTGRDDALHAVSLTLERMARGGIYDQLAGGFARYSVDNEWRVPHFEKMLDDNALLLRVYAHHARMTGSALSRRIALEAGEFLLREMRDGSGAFVTSLDADAGGVEGGTYRWTAEDMAVALADSPMPVADGLRVFGIDPERPDPDGDVLRLPGDPPDSAAFGELRRALLAHRNTRAQPGRDEIVVLRSNGLAITALAEAGAALERPEWVAAAAWAADAVMDLVHADGTRWCRSAFAGKADTAPATLADEASFAEALLALFQATGDAERLRQATDMLAGATARFRTADGTWHDTAAGPAAGDSDIAGGRDAASDSAAAASAAASGPTADGPAIMRPRDPTDGAAPSGLSSIAEALVTASALTGDSGLRATAEQITAGIGALATQHPRVAGWHLAVAESLVAGPRQIAISGPAGVARDELAAAARAHAPGGSVIDVGEPDEDGHPLLADRPGLEGRPLAYVCRGFVCDAPVASPADLTRALAR